MPRSRPASGAPRGGRAAGRGRCVPRAHGAKPTSEKSPSGAPRKASATAFPRLSPSLAGHREHPLWTPYTEIGQPYWGHHQAAPASHPRQAKRRADDRPHPAAAPGAGVPPSSEPGGFGEARVPRQRIPLGAAPEEQDGRHGSVSRVQSGSWWGSCRAGAGRATRARAGWQPQATRQQCHDYPQ